MKDIEWLHTFLREKYKIIITQEMEEENLFSSVIKLTVPEVAYLLVSISEHYEIPLENIMSSLSSEITYRSLYSAIDVLKSKKDD